MDGLSIRNGVGISKDDFSVLCVCSISLHRMYLVNGVIYNLKLCNIAIKGEKQ